MKTLKFLVLFIFISSLIGVTFNGCNVLTANKPHAKVTIFNSTAHYDEQLQSNWNIIRKAGKLNTTYKYKYVAFGNINANKYHDAHDSDLIILSYIPEEEASLIIVLSDDPIPDSNFFDN